MAKHKKIDKAKFETACELQATENEICALLGGIEDDTLNSWCKRTYDGKTFSEVFAEKRGAGLISLRRSQFRLSERDARMAIFLGKNYLGQTDSQTNVTINTNEKAANNIIILPNGSDNRYEDAD